AARLAGRTLAWFLGTSLIAVAVGIALGLITNPGHGVDLSLTGAKAPDTKGGWTDFLTGIIPTNVVGAFTGGNVLQLVFLGLVFGVAALKLGEAAEPVLALSESVLQLVQKALWWVIRLAPIGTAGLIGKAVATYGWDLLRPLATFTAAVYGGCLIVLLVVYPVLLRVVAGVNPIRFYARAWPAIELAFVSRS
ncbi:dicarboxylate/amino acid:cation symporter, partial [Nocardia gipuzkoensis]